ncbi:MAG: thioredoxin [Patescibacteria group bacterium]|jgi:thioredoxin 1
MSEVIFTDQNFESEVLKSDKPVLVDFWATWCGPCKMQGPIVEELAKELEGKAKVGKLEVDQNPQMAQKFGVMSIPTLAIFKNGKIAWQGIGLHQKGKLTEEVSKILPK